MKIIKAKDYDQMSRKAANIISAQVIMKPDCVLGLATGSSPIGTYRQLIDWYNKGDVDFSECNSVNLDEYVGLDITSDQSYVYFMRHNFFDAINIREDHTFIPNGKNTDVAAECERYDNQIASLGGIDLQLLGLGRNGHIGFNEPDQVFTKGTHCVDLAESTIEANKRFFASADDVPRQAFTMGICDIIQAKKVVMVVSGEDKADAVQKAFFGPVTPEVPASILQLHPDFTLIADEAALKKVLA